MGIGNESELILIAFVKQNKLQFSTNAFKDVLSKVGDRPVAVVSVNHPIEEQKNLIFNECLKYLQIYRVDDKRGENVFWKNKSDPDTKGIYLWSDPIIIKKSSQEVAILLMETNGCFDDKLATREDLLLFALNCVLSSTFIYSIPNEISTHVLDFLQLFVKYSKGGIGSELSDSYLNLVFLIRDWKPTKYSFGYHDSATCPLNTSHNYKKDRLFVYADGEHDAFKNRFCLDSFQKIACCLTPGIESESTDQNSNIPRFEDILGHTGQIIGRLFHPSSITIKRMGHQKFNGHLLVRFFEQLSVQFAESEAPVPEANEEDFRNRVRDAIALSNGIHYYKFEMNKTIDDNKYLSEEDLLLLHRESKKKALKLFQITRGMDWKGVKGLEENDTNEVLKDRFYELFDKEVQNVWQLYEELNRLKIESLKVRPITRQMVDNLLERVLKRKNEFDVLPKVIDYEVSQLFGFNLDALTQTVLSTIRV